MRAAFALPALLFLATAIPATAQDDCTVEATPCPWIVPVDGNGFVGTASWTFTQDEWHQLTVHNVDDAQVAHTVTLTGYGVSVTAGPDDEASATIQFTEVGTFTLKDMPSGKMTTITVTAGDSVDAQNSGGATGNTSKGGPGLGMPLALLAVAGVAMLMVRRKT